MARQRRGGRNPLELRGTLGTLLRTTLAQAGVVREALERGAREGRSRLDDALSTRRRTDALAELGEIVLDLIRRGEIDLDELPEVRDLVDHLDSLDSGHPDDHEEPPPATPRRRFDARGRDDVVTEAPPTRRRAEPRGRDTADDGTVSSKAWAPKRVAAPQRVWRPPVDIEIVPAPPPEEDEPPPAVAKKPARKGGISFGNDDEDDSDLAEYMHPDDVPPKAK